MVVEITEHEAQVSVVAVKEDMRLGSKIVGVVRRQLDQQVIEHTQPGRAFDQGRQPARAMGCDDETPCPLREGAQAPPGEDV